MIRSLGFIVPNWRWPADRLAQVWLAPHRVNTILARRLAALAVMGCAVAFGAACPAALRLAALVFLAAFAVYHAEHRLAFVVSWSLRERRMARTQKAAEFKR